MEVDRINVAGSYLVATDFLNILLILRCKSIFFIYSLLATLQPLSKNIIPYCLSVCVRFHSAALRGIRLVEN